MIVKMHDGAAQVDILDLDGGRKREQQPQLYRSLSTLAC
jgi:hypothetical protein